MVDMTVMECDYRRRTGRKIIISAAILAVTVVVAFLSIFANRYSGLSFNVTWDVLQAHFGGHEYGVYYYDLIVWDYYAPRAILGVLTGAGLAAGGAVMQSLLRNPLADPYTIGISSGASLGVALYVMLDVVVLPVSGYAASITTNAMLLSLIPTAVIVLISRRKNMTLTTTILAGVAVMYVFRAATSTLTLMADSDAVEQLYMWNVGTLVDARWSNVWIAACVVALGIAATMVLSRQMTVMTSGDSNARSMGVRTRLVRTVALVAVAFMTAVIVSYTGTIGFMGLVAPHVARMIVGSNLRYLIPCSAACGALILVLCDCATKLLSASVPVGVITSVIGGPIFILMLIKGSRRVWYRSSYIRDRAILSWTIVTTVLRS